MTTSSSANIRVIEEPIVGEPEPLAPDMRRYRPDRSLPAYRHVPGLNSHPTRDPGGHSFSSGVEVEPLLPATWHKNDGYLYAVDLYHQGYLWEANDMWVRLLSFAENDSMESNLLHALTLNGTAQMKARLSDLEGTRTRSQAARWRLARIRAKGYDGPKERFLGIDIAHAIQRICRHYGPVWESGAGRTLRLKGSPPSFRLKR